MTEHITAGSQISETGFSTRYENVVEAFCQPYGRTDTVKLIAVNVPRLTDRKRLAIGRRVWELAGRDLRIWDGANETLRLRWTQSHMGRHPWFEVTWSLRHESYSYTTPTSGGGGYPESRFFIEEVQ